MNKKYILISFFILFILMILTWLYMNEQYIWVLTNKITNKEYNLDENSVNYLLEDYIIMKLKICKEN